MAPKKVLTIAGSDCSGGAGIQADLKTFQERDVYGMSVLTVLVAMRPENWDHVVWPVDLEMIKTQFRTIFPGIGADAAKTGMLPTVEIIRTVGKLLAAAKIAHLVIDPVMVCKGTSEPLFPENTQAMIEHLLPIAEVVTPNTFEAAQLAGMDELKSEQEVEEAARRIHALGCKNVVIKVARIFDEQTADLLYDGQTFTWFREKRISTSWTHGAGCSFSACIAAELGKGESVLQACKTAHDFVYAGLKSSFPLNQHIGPIYHKALAKNA
ncbi:MAG: bifunctional hydroxymethylpyrimidine kinase/phosphomethylpyrimidine kinase [Lentisphaeria bacterium]